MTQDATTAIVDEATGFWSCYGCGKCTSGCPAADQMDFKPHQAMRLLQLGAVEELVVATAPWRCVRCQTCFARCPNHIDIPGAFSQICGEAMRRGTLEKAGNVPFFDELFLGMIRRRGRVNDGVMAFRYKLHAGGLLKDWRIGLKMWRAGKMKFRVPGVTDTASVERLFTEVGDSHEEQTP